MNKIALIELGLYAEGYYSGATYDETHMITREDFLKYYCDGKDLTDEELAKEVETLFGGIEISVGELDGKHSDVYGEVNIEYWDIDSIKEHYVEEVDCNGDSLSYKMTELAGFTDYASKEAFINNIENNVKALVDAIGIKVCVNVKVPQDKVYELLAFVDKLNTKK